MINFIKFVDKAQVRSIDGIKSSVYQALDSLYIMVQQNDHTDLALDIQHFTTIEMYIYWWALYEIKGDYRFIEYEERTILTNYGRRAKYNGIFVTRTFFLLVDFYYILNYNVNSFSDGGLCNTLDSLTTNILQYVKHGAKYIDFGVEATNPNVSPLEPQEEITILSKILPVIIELKSTYGFNISIDTYHPETVSWLIQNNLDVDVINDVSGNLPIDLIVAFLLGSQSRKYICGHSLSVPADHGKVLDITSDPVNVIIDWMHRKFFHINELMADIHSQLIFDVGIGFGKTASQSWYILHNLWRVRNTGYQLMVGYSRKTLFRYYGVNTFKERDFYGMSLAKHLSDHNLVDFIRVHYTDSELQALTF